MADSKIVVSGTVDEFQKNVGSLIFRVVADALKERDCATVGVSGTKAIADGFFTRILNVLVMEGFCKAI